MPLARIVSRESKYICKECHDIILQNSESKSDQQNSEDDSDGTADDSDKTSTDKGTDYAEIGKDLRQIISSDVTNLYREGKIKTISDLKIFRTNNWLAERPIELIELLSGLCNVDLNTSKDGKCDILAKVVELIYYCLNSKLMLPNHFKESLHAFSLTNCKTFSNFMGNRSPGGSYFSLVRVILSNFRLDS